MGVFLQFGAGNIGRGFMGQLFSEAGYSVVFVDVRKDLVDLLNAQKFYPLRLLDAYTKTGRDLFIGPVWALHVGEEDRVAEVFAEAEAVGTAVGVRNLPDLAPLLALGIRKRRALGKGPVDVYLCENARDAAGTLKDAVLSCLTAEERAWTEAHIGFVGTSVARMVLSPEVLPESHDPLLVVADAYREFPYDAQALRASTLSVAGMKPVRNFVAEFFRKFHTHNLGHATLAYLGYLRGLRYIHEGFQDSFVSEVFERALDETSRALLRRFSQDLDPEEHRRIRQDIRVRFGNPLLQDTVYRVARDPLRKLAPSERLIGSAHLCLEEGVFPEYVACVCAAALCYDWRGDPEAVRLQEMLREEGLAAVLAGICGVLPESPLGERVREWYAVLKTGQKRW
ncbi:mannitol-1-phosphate 5-dehydrogenase [Candidatus Caldatribacterium sp. SIUC1]|uniref:mannitol dehydrogenase family protein n=1 Tax=Candidatus Caldatribacterium sp. SIUC1 TaxID=3418365 RepID=UPI003F68EFC8